MNMYARACFAQLGAFVHITGWRDGGGVVKEGTEEGGRKGGAALLMRHSSSAPKWDEHAGDKEVAAVQAGTCQCAALWSVTGPSGKEHPGPQ